MDNRSDEDQATDALLAQGVIGKRIFVCANFNDAVKNFPR